MRNGLRGMGYFYKQDIEATITVSKRSLRHVLGNQCVWKVEKQWTKAKVENMSWTTSWTWAKMYTEENPWMDFFNRDIESRSQDVKLIVIGCLWQKEFHRVMMIVREPYYLVSQYINPLSSEMHRRPSFPANIDHASHKTLQETKIWFQRFNSPSGVYSV